MPGDISIVKSLPGSSGSRCGYCKSTDGYFNTGAWAFQLTTTDYQDLIDRGWRRSGMYCYKPTMELTCCPLYTIRCEAVNFKLTKSQKKILKRFHKFLADGIVPKRGESSDKEEIGSGDDHVLRELAHEVTGISESEKNMRLKVDSLDDSTRPDSPQPNPSPQKPSLSCQTKQMELSSSSTSIADVPQGGSLGGRKSMSIESINRKTPKQGDGMDPSKPQCKKAKLLRLERKQKKLEALGLPPPLAKHPPKNQEKTLEDFLNEPLPQNAAHTFQMRLVSCRDEAESFRDTWKLFVKYQMKVHGETEDEWDFESFLEFLVRPLKPKKESKLGSTVPSYGSYHQQYYIDGKLFAVGVIDVLPFCVSSVYFFYDPDYMFLSLGTYGSLREVSLVRSLVKECPALEFYYLGYYIHSCPKMRYKGRIGPSFLLCPEAYTWHPLSDSLPKLDASKYSRLNPDPSATSPDSQIDVDKVLVLCGSSGMSYRNYCARWSQGRDREEVAEYARLVGRKCSQRIYLLRDPC